MGMRQPLTNPRMLDREDEWSHYPGARKSSTSNPSKKSSFIRLYQKPNQGAQSFPHADYIKTTLKKKKKRLQNWKLENAKILVESTLWYRLLACSMFWCTLEQLEHTALFLYHPIFVQSSILFRKKWKGQKRKFRAARLMWQGATAGWPGRSFTQQYFSRVFFLI